MEGRAGSGLLMQGHRLATPAFHTLGLFPFRIPGWGGCHSNGHPRTPGTETEGKNITIYSDSQAAIKAFNRTSIDSPLVRETLCSLEKTAQTNILHLEWIPSHSNFAGNEKADQLARKGSSAMSFCPELPFPARTCSVEIERWMELKHKKNGWSTTAADKQNNSAEVPTLTIQNSSSRCLGRISDQRYKL